MTEAEIDRALDSSDWHVRLAAILSTNATEANINKALDDINYCICEAAAFHENATEANIDKALTLDNIYNAICNPNATANNLRKAFKTGNMLTKLTILSQKNVDEDILLSVFSMKQATFLKINALNHKNVTEKVLEKAIKSKTIEVRALAARHPYATKKIKEKAANDAKLISYLLKN